jgi:hypothetical protein
VAQVRNIRPGYTVIRPNRDKASCKVTKAVVVLIMIVSIALMLALTIGGWSELEGLKPVNFVWCIVYAVIGFYIWRWARGLLLIIAVIAGTGLSGTSWFDREHVAFANAQSLFGGTGLSDSTLGLLTVLLIPVQVALIVFAMIGFAQGWNVELEVPEDEARRRGSSPVARGPQPAAA